MKRSLPQWLQWQEHAHDKAWDLGLERIRTVWQRLPLKSFRIAKHIITVAGTNGKGSCVCWAEEICRLHGISVASFTSPHLRDYRERIRFNGVSVEPNRLIQAFEIIDKARGDISLSYFEWSALAAFYLMATAKTEIAVLEVGLGGRLDATNLIDADVAIMTRIGLDHQDWLGHDTESIAREKAGIMRHKQRVFLADRHPPQIFYRRGEELQAQIYSLGKELTAENCAGNLHINVPGFEAVLPLPVYMYGEHQYGHLAAVLAALAPWFSLDKEKVCRAVCITRNEGRLMLYPGKPGWLFDVAHNADSAEVLAGYLHAFDRGGGRIIAICGMLKDKDHHAVFRHLCPEIDYWLLTGLTGSRATDSNTLTQHALDSGIAAQKLSSFPDITAALAAARQMALPQDTLVVFGSFVTVSATLEKLKL